MQRVFGRSCVSLFCLVVFLLPNGSLAQSPNNYTSVFALVAQLQQQIDMLRAQLAASTIDAQDRNLDSFYVSEFYNGPYVSLYQADGYQLALQRGVYNNTHQLLWNMFVDIAGESDARTYVREFRIFNDRDAAVSAFIDQTDENQWILALNTADIYFEDAWWQHDMAELLLHEYAHIVLHNTPGLIDQFTDRYWSDARVRTIERINNFNNTDAREDAVYEFYHTHEDEFVSEYAATNPLEDAVESFVQFVKEERSYGDELRDEKQNFFYQYPALFTDVAQLRSRIRKYLPL